MQLLFCTGILLLPRIERPVSSIFSSSAGRCTKFFIRPDTYPSKGMTATATFNSHDATLNTLLSEDLLTATPFVSGSLSRLWSGARCNSSASGGKVFFVVNIVKQELGDDTELQPEAMIGISSRAVATAQLGSGSSCAYSSSGQKWTASKPEAFGVKFSAGDSIGCFLDLETCTISFSHNGTWLGQAYQLPKPEQRLGGLHPHVLLKGFAAEIDFTESGRSDWPAEASGYTSWMVCKTAVHGL